jgi:Domain of unknown function (DUF4145)
MLYPAFTPAPPPSADMPPDVLEEYSEAASVVQQSPRSAGAMLRLAVERLMPHLGAQGKDLNDRIGDLVIKGLSPDVQRALDSLRVVGNNAVHPGELDLRDDTATAIALFGLLNLVIDQMITRPKKIAAMWETLPSGAREAVQRRDGQSEGST